MATKPLFKITKPATVGIFNSCYKARVYSDKIITETPYIHWENNSGSLDMAKQSIRKPETIKEILQELEDGCEDTAWELIGHALQDPYLIAD